MLVLYRPKHCLLERINMSNIGSGVGLDSDENPDSAALLKSHESDVRGLLPLLRKFFVSPSRRGKLCVVTYLLRALFKSE